MIPKRFRLKRSRLFPKTVSAGKALGQNPFMLVLALPRAYVSDTPTRFGFVVSRKVHNRAVIRNKVKRRLREIVRLHLKGLPPESRGKFQAISIVVIARKAILEASYQQLEQALTQWLKMNA